MSIYIQIEFGHNSIWLIVRRYWASNQFNSDTNSTDNIRVWFILIRFIMNWYADISWSLWHFAQVYNQLAVRCIRNVSFTFSVFDLNVNWSMCNLNILNIRIFIASILFEWQKQCIPEKVFTSKILAEHYSKEKLMPCPALPTLSSWGLQ